MKVIQHILGATLWLVSNACISATLAPESLVCEAAESISFVKRTPHLAGNPASKVMEQVNAQLQYAELQKKSAAIFRNLATQESAIAGTGYAKPADRTAQIAEAEADRGTVENVPYTAIAQGCASSGGTPLHAEVIESKPISGIGKVSIMFKGQLIQVYVSLESINN